MATVIGAKDRKSFERHLQDARMITRRLDREQFRDLTHDRILKCYAGLLRSRERLNDREIDAFEASLEAWLFHSVEKYF
jgi:hypothetical protein